MGCILLKIAACMRFANRSSLRIARMSDNPVPMDLDHHQVRHLLQLLRNRTPEEVTIGALLFAPAFNSEMKEALSNRGLERKYLKAKGRSDTHPKADVRAETVAL